MDMNDLISIIIPAYNVEKYLDRCLNSVVSQTYKNIEIILVDDGSANPCALLCDDWAKKDQRIKAFHKKNGGLSDARNYGVKKATGEYVFFVDSDDCISFETIETLYKAIKDNDAEIACCNYVIFSNDEPEYTEDKTFLVAENGQKACETMMCKKAFMITAWANLIKKQIVVDNPFPLNRYQEDEAITYKYYYQSKKTVVLDRKLYGYFRNENGIMKSPDNRKKNTLDLLLALEEQLEFFKSRKEEKLYRLVYTRYTRCFAEAYYQNYIVVDKKEAKQVFKKDIKNKNERFLYKVFLIMVLLFGKRMLGIKYK